MYSSGGLTTAVNYLMMLQDRKYLWDVRAIPEDEAASEHHLILIRI